MNFYFCAKLSFRIHVWVGTKGENLAKWNSQFKEQEYRRKLTIFNFSSEQGKRANARDCCPWLKFWDIESKKRKKILINFFFDTISRNRAIKRKHVPFLGFVPTSESKWFRPMVFLTWIICDFPSFSETSLPSMRD